MRRHIVRIGLVLAAVGAAAACSSEPDLGPVFDNEGDQPVSCMVHQADEPGTRYTDPATRQSLGNTGQILAVMKYYTAHGGKPYCDGDAADEADQAWARLYVDLGGSADKVSGVLG